MPNSTLDRVASAGLREVLLPGTLTWVRLRIPGVDTMLRRRMISSDLRAVATKFGTAGVNLDDASEEEVEAFLRFSNEMVALCWRAVDPRGPAAGPTPPAPDEWEPVSLTPELLEEYDFDEDDVQAIAGIALRRQSARIVTLIAKRDAGWLTAEELRILDPTLAQAREDEPTSGSFPGPDRIAGGDHPRADGGAVVDDAELDPPDRGPGTRDDGGRRDRTPADAGGRPAR